MTGANEGADEGALRHRIDQGLADTDDYYALADLLLAERRQRDAIEVYQRALSQPLDSLAHGEVAAQLAKVLYDMDQPGEAVAVSTLALARLTGAQRGPRCSLLRGLHQSVLAHSLWPEDTRAASEAAQTALRWLEEAIAGGQGVPDLLAAANSETAILHGLLGNLSEAIAAAETCLGFDLQPSGRVHCLITIADALRRAERLDEAERRLLEALGNVEPSDQLLLPRIYYELGLVQKASGEPQEAQRTLIQALDALQAHPYLHDCRHFLTEIHWNLAETEYEAGQYEQAREWFTRVLDAHPGDDDYRRNALLWVGHSYLAERAPKQARACYEEVLRSPAVSVEEARAAEEGLSAIRARPEWLRRWLFGKRG